MIDVNNSLDGDGPMSPERCGGIPFGTVMELCFSGEYTKYDKKLMGWIKDRVGFIATVKVLPGEHEMEALASGVLRVLRNEESLQIYPNVQNN